MREERYYSEQRESAESRRAAAASAASAAASAAAWRRGLRRGADCYGARRRLAVCFRRYRRGTGSDCGNYAVFIDRRDGFVVAAPLYCAQVVSRVRWGYGCGKLLRAAGGHGELRGRYTADSRNGHSRGFRVDDCHRHASGRSIRGFSCNDVRRVKAEDELFRAYCVRARYDVGPCRCVYGEGTIFRFRYGDILRRLFLSQRLSARLGGEVQRRASAGREIHDGAGRDYGEYYLAALELFGG